MCGIAGIYRRGRPQPGDPQRLVAMSDLLAHRGPDDAGSLLLDSTSGAFRGGADDGGPRLADVLLAHRRLAIIDLSASARQPMRDGTGDLFLVFNGEIFNYLELRLELASRGHRFFSNGDSEVVLRAYREWGRECVTRFNGMWAFALWDQRSKELFCSRDRFGIKPFYYHLSDTGFVFASEIKAILPVLPERPRPNFGVVSDYLFDGALCRSSETFFADVRRLPPAHNLVVSADGARTTRYWDYPRGEALADDGRSSRTFRDLLDDAVRLRLRSDVPVGIALSGGVDSSSLLALAARAMEPRPVKAFTAVFPGHAGDERPFAEAAARSAGAELLCVEYEPQDFLQDLRAVTWILDYPTTEPQVLPRWRLMELVGGHVKVVLEGQGADEMLAGYVARYFGAHVVDELVHARSSHDLLAVVAAFRDVRRQYGRLAYEGLLRQLAPAWAPRRALRAMWESTAAYTDDFTRSNAGRSELLPGRDFPDRLTNLLHFDHGIGILPLLLKFGDALSMAHSVESRLPYLDHRVVEFIFRLPPRRKLRGTSSKVILKEAMAGMVPDAILSRRDKVGFVTPVGRWIERSMESDIRPLLLSPRCRNRGIFDARKVASVLTRQMQGRAHAEQAIFRWLSVELWFRLFIDGDGYPAGRRAAPSHVQ